MRCRLARPGWRTLAAVLVAAALIAGAMDRPLAQATARSAAACPAPAEPLAGVWGPSRLLLLAPCRRVVGSVRNLRREIDGDLTFDLVVKGQYRSLVNPVNRRELGDALHVEFIPRDGGHLFQPRAGDTLALTGAWVTDTVEGWNELHPVFSESINGGVAHRSGPQFGGSPATSNELNASELCLDQEGQICQGNASVVGRCLSVRPHSGAYGDPGCTTAASGRGRFEWFPATGARHALGEVPFTTSIPRHTVVEIETRRRKEVRCSGERGSGAYGSRKAFRAITIDLTGCSFAGARCQSPGRPPGEVSTNELSSTVGRIQTSGRAPALNRAGSSLEPSAGVSLAQFACGGLAVTISGSAIGVITANTMSRHQLVTFSALQGRQTVTQFEHTRTLMLEASFGGAPPEPAALAMKLIQTSARPVEINGAI
jgi:hypothetical protein